MPESMEMSDATATKTPDTSASTSQLSKTAQLWTAATTLTVLAIGGIGLTISQANQNQRDAGSEATALNASIPTAIAQANAKPGCELNNLDQLHVLYSARSPNGKYSSQGEVILRVIPDPEHLLEKGKSYHLEALDLKTGEKFSPTSNYGEDAMVPSGWAVLHPSIRCEGLK
jgi:hypothetical protein